MKLARSVAILTVLFISFSVHPQVSRFVVGDIRLQEDSKGVCGYYFNILPVSVGETLDILRTSR